MQDQNQTFTDRPLGAHERLFFHYSSAHPRHFCIVAQLRAVKGVDDYRRALSALHSRHPLLRAGVRQTPGGGPAFYHQHNAPQTIVISDGQQPHWTEIVARELETGFEAHGPLYRAVVIWRKTGACVILTFHHAIADGIAALAMVEDLMRSLAGEVLKPLAVPDSLEAHEALQPDLAMRDDVVSDVNLPAKEALIAASELPRWRSFDSDEVLVSAASLEASWAERLHDVARRESTTVNSAICVALALAAREAEGRSQYAILSPFDLRPIVGAARADCALRVSGGVLSLSDVTRETFWTHARSHRDQINELRGVERIKRFNLVLETLVPPDADERIASGLLGSMGYDAIVSNLGKVSMLERVGDVELEGIWGPAAQDRSKNERFVGVVTAANGFRLIEARPGHQSSLLDALVQNLVSICAD